MGHRKRNDAGGFTFGKLLVVLATVTLLMGLAIPVLANTKLRSQRVVCVSNLSQIGQACNKWGSDHGDRYPMYVPYWDGGLRPASPGTIVPIVPVPAWLTAGLHNNLYWQYYWLRNELQTPRVLACPSDSAKRVAQGFEGGPLGLRVLQDKAVSYFLGHPVPQLGRSILCGDRNVTGKSLNEACGSTGYTVMHGVSAQNAGWSSEIHVESGNLLFNDGSVEQVDRTGLQRAVRPGVDSEMMHLLPPQ